MVIGFLHYWRFEIYRDVCRLHGCRISVVVLEILYLQDRSDSHRSVAGLAGCIGSVLPVDSQDSMSAPIVKVDAVGKAQP